MYTLSAGNVGIYVLRNWGVYYWKVKSSHLSLSFDLGSPVLSTYIFRSGYEAGEGVSVIHISCLISSHLGK